MEKLGIGEVRTIVGAAGGVKFIPTIIQSEAEETLITICEEINQPSRIIPGGLVYTLDLLYDPKHLKKIAKILSHIYREQTIDYVLTIETKGIPLATITAELFNVPLVIARDENKLTEGATVGINYVSGSTGDIRTMFISKNAIKPQSNVLIVDDFMRGGGTAKGMQNLVRELDSHIVGTSFLIEIVSDQDKLIDEYNALINLEEISKKEVKAKPNYNLLKKYDFFKGDLK
jgi:purine operon repressor